MADLETAENVGKVVNGVEVKWVFERMLSLVSPDSCEVIVAHGDNALKRKAVVKLKQIGFRFATAISPLAAISPWASIGEGAIINPYAAILPNARVGRHVVVHSQAVIEHDCVLGDYVSVAPGVSLGGRVVVGEAAYVYTGASVKPGVTIGREAVVGAGAVVIRDVSPGVVVAGVPAVRIGDSRSRHG